MKFALYGLSDFDEGQQLEFLSLSAKELALATSRPGLQAQVYCILQIGYFKAKHAFFHFSPQQVESDYDFVVQHYFREASPACKTITDHEYNGGLPPNESENRYWKNSKAVASFC